MTQTLATPATPDAVSAELGAVRDDLVVNGQRPSDAAAAASLKDLVATASKDLSTLVRKEVELAKAELTITVTGVVKGVAPLLGALVFVLGAALLLVFTIAEAYNEILPRPIAFLAGAATLLVLAGIAALIGKALLGRVQKPARTPVTVKDDIAWAKAPTKSPAPTHDGGTGPSRADLEAQLDAAS